MKNTIKRLLGWIMAQFEEEQQNQQPADEQQAQDAVNVDEQDPVTKSISADDVKQGLDLAGKDVSGVWEDVVKFAEASADEFEVAAKKALEFIGHEAFSAFDAVVSLLKHKK